MQAPSSLNVTPNRRLAYGLIDWFIILAIWILTQVITSKSFPIGFMQRYKQENFDAYIEVMTWLTLILFVLSIFMHKFFGGSIGKLLLGCRTVMSDGSRLTWRAAFFRASALFLIGLLILAPGPMIAFVFGEGSEVASLVVLGLGLGLWIFFALAPRQRPDQDPPPSKLETLFGIRTISRAGNRHKTS